MPPFMMVSQFRIPLGVARRRISLPAALHFWSDYADDSSRARHGPPASALGRSLRQRLLRLERAALRRPALIGARRKDDCVLLAARRPAAVGTRARPRRRALGGKPDGLARERAPPRPVQRDARRGRGDRRRGA